jgi:nucleotide-binding universal stress UspA family protein
MFKKILVGYDGSKGGGLALERAIELARLCGAQVTALWVQEPLPRYSDLPGELDEQAEAGEQYLNLRRKEVDEIATSHGLTVACLSRRGHPAKALVTMAHGEGFDLIVVGHSDHSAMWGRLLGDTADRVSDHAHCCVFIVKD